MSESEHNKQEGKLERSFMKQNFGPHPGRDMQGDAVPDEEQELIDKDLKHLHNQSDDARGSGE
ncbi:MAG: hypothetical protein ABF780_03840 [Bifidobacterium aquikefiri]|uniref:Uncharacterized protein n=1 Tax=Bifidobacterium aquikefiri TaxID=1653207 RepID=A0A261G0Z4_9BIFI|nr:hypothetical protein [Bifidobacterium aquikefiri]OZG65104.1 hypothetical protein BAQU_1844 [Bifidobacterium aquikefiri]